MKPSSPLIRQWLILQQLGVVTRGVTVQELARELHVAEKTIRRDLAMFARTGFPLREETGEHGQKFWRLKYPHDAPGISFNVDEALALYLGRRLLDPLSSTHVAGALQNAFRKIRAAVGRGALAYLDKLAGAVHVTLGGASDYRERSALLDDLLRAIVDRKATLITYRPLRATEPVEYDVHPYGLITHKQSLYLVAWSRDSEQIRTFKLDRFASVEVTSFDFQRPDDFDLQQFLAGSFGVFQGDGDVQVQIRFSSTVARYVQEGRWHASQKLTPQRDGSLRAEFELSSTEEIKRWVLSFGAHAIVLEPENLRQEIATELTTLQRVYGDARAGRPG